MLYEPIQYVITGKRVSDEDICAVMEELGKEKCLYRMWKGSIPYLQSIANKVRDWCTFARCVVGAHAILGSLLGSQCDRCGDPRQSSRIEEEAGSAAVLTGPMPMSLPLRHRHTNTILVPPVCVWWRMRGGPIVIDPPPHALCAPVHSLLNQQHQKKNDPWKSPLSFLYLISCLCISFHFIFYF